MIININKKLVIYCFGLAIFIKQFYIFESGTFQISDLIFMIASVFSIVLYSKNKRSKLIEINKTEILFFIFCLSTLFINILYLIKDSRFQIIIGSLQYIYNFIVIFSVSYLIDDLFFYHVLNKICKLNLVLQIIVYFTGIGRQYSYDRYMGTFNDPNQFAFFVYSSFLLIYICSKTEKKPLFLWYIAYLFLTITSASTGMFLGLSIFTIFYICHYLIYEKKQNKGIVLLFCLLIAFILFFSLTSIGDSFENSYIFLRITGKIDKLDYSSGNFILNFIKDRNLTAILEYPEKIIYGAGEAAYSTYSKGELHNSILNPLFSYGIIPCLLLIIWVYKNIKNIDSKYYCVYISLIVESLTLVNNRQPLFWIILLLGRSIFLKKNSKISN